MLWLCQVCVEWFEVFGVIEGYCVVIKVLCVIKLIVVIVQIVLVDYGCLQVLFEEEMCVNLVVFDCWCVSGMFDFFVWFVCEDFDEYWWIVNVWLESL